MSLFSLNKPQGQSVFGGSTATTLGQSFVGNVVGMVAAFIVVMQC
jgi:hypothetical protein